MKPVLIIAELSANHGHDFSLAAETIRAAKRAGADAVKVQTYTPDTITLDSTEKYFTIEQGTIWDGRNLYDLYREAYMPWDWQPKLKEVADKEGILFFSSPFDKTAVDFLEKLDVPFYKIASFEINDTPLISYAASKMKPVFISTGVATLSEIEMAVDACRRVGNEEITLLKCTSSYPAPVDEMNLRFINTMRELFNVPVGLSDHSTGWNVATLSVAFGVSIIEKHFILDKRIGGPDSSFSMEPSEFSTMVSAVRDAEKALGKSEYYMSSSMKNSRKFMRSLFITKTVKKGEIFSEDNVRSIRPGDGLPPYVISEVIGRRARFDITPGTPLRWGLVE